MASSNQDRYERREYPFLPLYRLLIPFFHRYLSQPENVDLVSPKKLHHHPLHQAIMPAHQRVTFSSSTVDRNAIVSLSGRRKSIVVRQGGTITITAEMTIDVMIVMIVMIVIGIGMRIGRGKGHRMRGGKDPGGMRRNLGGTRRNLGNLSGVVIQLL